MYLKVYYEECLFFCPFPPPPNPALSLLPVAPPPVRFLYEVAAGQLVISTNIERSVTASRVGDLGTTSDTLPSPSGSRPATAATLSTEVQLSPVSYRFATGTRRSLARIGVASRRAGDLYIRFRERVYVRLVPG